MCKLFCRHSEPSLDHSERKKLTPSPPLFSLRQSMFKLRSKTIRLLKMEGYINSNRVSLKLRIKMRRTKGIDKATRGHDLPLVSEPLPTFVSSL